MDVYLTRQPIFDHNGGIYAFELLYRESSGKHKNEPSPNGGVTLFGVDLEAVSGGAKALIKFDPDDIVFGVPRTLPSDNIAVEVSGKAAGDDEVVYQLRNLKSSGYTIVLDDVSDTDAKSELFKLCDMVKIDIGASLKSAEGMADLCRGANKQTLAKNVETLSQLELAKKLGCKYMQGYFFAHPDIKPGSELQPLPANLMEVMRLMAQPEPEINDIVDVMSRDAAMCQKILRLINSVYFGVSNKVSSISQAILILGLDYLREWVYLMGMQKISNNDNVEAMKLALLLAKFCRRLSELIPEEAEKGDSFYLMGLLSMLVFGSDRVLAQALDEFPLSNDIKKGLLRRGGTYSDVFEMALAFVDGKWEEFDEIAEKYELDHAEISARYVLCLSEISKLNLS